MQYVKATTLKMWLEENHDVFIHVILIKKLYILVEKQLLLHI